MSELKEVKEDKGVAHRVSVSLGYTRNMGNFESLRVDIGLEADGYGNPDPTFNKVYDWAEQKLITKVAEVEEQLKDGKSD